MDFVSFHFRICFNLFINGTKKYSVVFDVT